LFCYAAARRLAIANEAELVIDDVTGFVRDKTYRRQYALTRFQIPARKATPAERMEPFERCRRGRAKFLARRRPFHLRRYVEQEGIDFDPRLLDFKVKGTVYLDGLWQSEGYFKDVADVIRADLTIIPPHDSNNREMSEHIIRCNAVAVHVRAAHNLARSYYERAIKKIIANTREPHFFVFADQPNAARGMLELPDHEVMYIRHNRGDENAHADLWLMSKCRHFIIANSTFSWWGAWLSRHQQKLVIAPGCVQSGICSWGFPGLLPEEWIRL